jgi:hypothetical protein
MRALLDSDPMLFAGALLFSSREGLGFVLLQDDGEVEDPRTWLRWPLRRLFTVRHACIITNPSDSRRALALPLIASRHRYVIVAALRTDNLDQAQSAFLEALQSITIRLPSRAVANETIPRFAWFGEDQRLAERLCRIAATRGWELQAVRSFGHALMLLESDAVDVALVDDAAIKEPLYALRAMRHAARVGDAPILYFSLDDPGTEVRALVDDCIATNAADGELVKALKGSAQLIPRTRSRALHARVRRIDENLRSCKNYDELARACANAAVVLGGDAVSVMLADEMGFIHSAHIAQRGDVFEDRWPTPFVTGEAVMHTHAGERFFEDVFDDAVYARRVRELRPISGAAIPISDGAEIIGTLLAFSTGRAMFAPEFDALSEMAERTGRAFAALRSTSNANGAWQRIALRDAFVDVYRGSRAHALIRVDAQDGAVGIVALEAQGEAAVTFADWLLRQVLDKASHDEPAAELYDLLRQAHDGMGGMLLAVLGADDRLTYACSGLPPPIHVPLSGPVPAIAPARMGKAGTLVPEQRSLTLICSNELAEQIETARLVSAVQRGLRGGGMSVAHVLPELSRSEKTLAFASIVMLTSDVDLPHPPVFV